MARGHPELNRRRWSWLLEFCDVRQDDLDLLAAAFSRAGLGSAVADAFVQMTSTYPELHELIDRTVSVAQFKQRLSSYVDSMFAGRFDDARVAALGQIGFAHDRVGLPLATFLGATLQIDKVIITALVGHFGDDGERLTRAILAYRKLATCDVAIISQTFFEARGHTTEAAINRLEPEAP